MSVFEVGDVVSIVTRRSAGLLEVVYVRSDGASLVILPTGTWFGWQIEDLRYEPEYLDIIRTYRGRRGWWLYYAEVEVIRRAGGKRRRKRKSKPLNNKVCRAICAVLTGGLVSSRKG